MAKNLVFYGDLMRMYRTKHGYRQRDMADRLGISQQVYGYYENGKRKPNIEFALKYKKLTGVDLIEGVEQIYFTDNKSTENITAALASLAMENNLLKAELLKNKTTIADLEKRLAVFLRKKKGTHI